MTRIPAVAVTVMIAGWNAADAQAVLLAAAALAVAGMVLLALRSAPRPAPYTPARRYAALRERAVRAAVIRVRDPDAAGRPRPRAPSALAGAA
jgi:hypothetical protein